MLPYVSDLTIFKEEGGDFICGELHNEQFRPGDPSPSRNSAEKKRSAMRDTSSTAPTSGRPCTRSSPTGWHWRQCRKHATEGVGDFKAVLQNPGQTMGRSHDVLPPRRTSAEQKQIAPPHRRDHPCQRVRRERRRARTRLQPLGLERNAFAAAAINGASAATAASRIRSAAREAASQKETPAEAKRHRHRGGGSGA
jgi:hypothetical protein